MANVLRVREGITTYEDPGPYQFSIGTVAEPVIKEELKRNGIQIEN